MSANAPLPPELHVWQAQLLRLTAFPVDPQYGIDQNWWRELTGVDCETSTRKKHEREDQGVFDGATLSLSIDLARIQWAAAANVAFDANIGGLPLLGSFLEKKDWFCNAMCNWLASCPPLKRLAFGGVLIQPVDSREAGYQQLDQYLRSVDVDPQSSDLLYRINRPSTSAVRADLKVNRLSTWSVPRFSVELGTLEPGTFQSQAIVRHEMIGCGLELDINTAPDPDLVLEPVVLSQLFAELVEMGTQIACLGDVRQ